MTDVEYIEQVWGQVKAFCQSIKDNGQCVDYDIKEFDVEVVHLEEEGRMYPMGGFTAILILNQYTKLIMEINFKDISETINAGIQTNLEI